MIRFFTLPVISFCLLIISCTPSPVETERIYDLKSTGSVIDSILMEEGFAPGKEYAPLSLQYLGQPIFAPGQHIRKLPGELSFRFDPNLKYQEKYPFIVDYLCTDNQFFISQTTGSLNGILYFSTDSTHQQIFNISASWLLDIDINEVTQKEAIESISNSIFPILKDKMTFEDNWSYTHEHQNYDEVFQLKAPAPDGHWWSFRYDVKMKK